MNPRLSLRSVVSLAAFLLFPPLIAAANAPAVFPNERLDYSINWPSGLSFGEAHWKATNTATAQAPAWNLQLSFEAHIPGFALVNSYSTSATANYCLEQLTRTMLHGSRNTTETETVDAKTLIATRKTQNGGESTIAVPDCVKDALSFLFLTRHELLSGRIPPSQTILLGAQYQVTLSYLGTHSVKSGDRLIDADRVTCAVKGPASAWKAEIDFARDPVRTPLAVRIPVSLGTIALELVR